jgi:hypothetical protein
MASGNIGSSARREFLSFLAASPLLAYAGFAPRWLEEVHAKISRTSLATRG